MDHARTAHDGRKSRIGDRLQQKLLQLCLRNAVPQSDPGVEFEDVEAAPREQNREGHQASLMIVEARPAPDGFEHVLAGQFADFAEEASRAVAREALARKVGARGLRMILEELMLDLMYHLPSNKKIKELDITAEMVQKRDLSVTLLDKAG